MLLPALPSASGPFVGPGDRYPNRQLKTKSVPVWLLADSQPHSLHSLKRFFWRRSIVINHFGSKGASPALPSAPPCTEARRGPILARKRWASGIAASTLSSSGARPNPCSPTTKPEFPKNEENGLGRRHGPSQPPISLLPILAAREWCWPASSVITRSNDWRNRWEDCTDYFSASSGMKKRRTW